MTDPTESLRLRISSVRIFNTRALLTLRINEPERRRREQLGLGALTRLDTLNGLLGLPLDLPVAMADLTARERKLVDRLAYGVVELDGETLTRRAKPVVAVQRAAVYAQSWQAGLVNAGKFAPYCERLMILRKEPPDDACLEASYYGVGVTVQTATGLRELLPPEPWIQHLVTPAGWWFTEEAYRQSFKSERPPCPPRA